jgi:hypothetical protein
MSLKKLIGLLSILLVVGIISTTINVNAHRPMHLDFKYETDPSEPDYQVLKVTIIHGVTDPTIHYVSDIEIEIDHVSVLNVSYTSQPTKNIFTYQYPGIVATFGVTDVTVNARCSLDGLTSMHIIWAYYEDKGTFASVIVPTLISTILVALIVLLPAISQKLKNRK